MKRIVVSLTVMLSSCLAFLLQAEEPDSDSRTILEIVPRLEVCALPSTVTGGGTQFNLGQSSLYTLFEGDFGKGFSYSLSNHWLSAGPSSLYVNPFRPSQSSFLDWAHISYSTGGWSLCIGKMSIALGTFEFDPYDVDIHQDMVSTVWNNIFCYQWGGLLSYTLPDGNTTFKAQCLSSQFTEGVLFSDCLKTISLGWNGVYDFYESYWTFNMFERAKGDFINVIALGNRFTSGDFTGSFNYMNRWVKGESFFNDEMSFIVLGEYSFSNHFAAGIMSGYEFAHGCEDLFGCGSLWSFDGSYIPSGVVPGKDYLYAGLYFHYFPVEGLRIHANTALNNYAGKPTFSAGVTYHFNIIDLF